MSRIKRAQRLRFRKVCLILFLVVILLFCVSFPHLIRMVFPLKYEALVEQYAEENNLPQELVYSIIYCESEFDPEAVSSIGARGLMQITKSTFEWAQMKLGKDFAEDTYDDMFDPETNIKYGCGLFKLLLQEYKTVPNALCAYHAGWGTARKWLKDETISPDGKNIENIPYQDTAQYVDKVMRVAEIYRKLYDL